MSICLRYVWIKNYNCLKSVGFQFDEKYEFTYCESNNNLKIELLNVNFLSDFWDTERRFININSLVGNNGNGKTTFLRAIMTIFSQIFPSEELTNEEYKYLSYSCPAIMIIQDVESKEYKILCMGIDGLHVSSSSLVKTSIVYDKFKIRDILYKVKVAFFSNAFDYRDYIEPKAEHISDYSFGGLLKSDFDKELLYQRNDRCENPISEQFYHSIYRQVSFMTEFYSILCDKEQKKMFSSWPKFLHIQFKTRRGKESESLCFYGIFEQVLAHYVVEEDAKSGGHGVSSLFFVEKRLEGLLSNKQSKLKKTSDKIRYQLCRESFQNLLMMDSFRSFYYTPNYKENGKELLPIVKCICSVIDEFGNAKKDYIKLKAEEIFEFYKSIQKSLNKLGESANGKVSIVSKNFAKMLELILLLPEDLFLFENFNEIGIFDFDIRCSNPEYIDKFNSFLNQYKKIVLPFSFLNFEWGMSSGENNMLSLYSQLFAIRDVEEGTNYHKKQVLNYIRNLKADDQKENYDIVLSDTIWILMDEADLTFHPKWQIEFISNLIWFFPQILPDTKMKLQVFFTTHSPILLCDMPSQNVIYLEKKDNEIIVYRNLQKNTFGQNIYMLFQDSFFIDGPMGRFASDKMKEITKTLFQTWNCIEELYNNSNKVNQSNIDHYQEVLDSISLKIQMFGDQVVVNKWKSLLDICQYKLETCTRKSKSEKNNYNDEIKRLKTKKKWIEQQIIDLENKKNDKNIIR